MASLRDRSHSSRMHPHNARASRRGGRRLTRCSQRDSLAPTMAEDQRAFVVGPGEGRVIDLGAFGMTLKADAEQTGGVVSVLEAEEPPGFGPPIHVHHDAAEAFYVLEGEYIMYLEDREFTLRGRSFLSRAVCGTDSWLGMTGAGSST